MKRIAAIWLVLAAVLVIAAGRPVYAGPLEEYEEAHSIYAAAGACMASYSNTSRSGRLAYSYLEQEGWVIEPYVQTSGAVDARFLMAKKRLPDGHFAYLFAVTGTETLKDVKTDLNTDKVYFAGRTPQEFAENAGLDGMPADVPKVHRGFHDYVQVALTAKTNPGGQTFLYEDLLADPASKVVLAGHSLGGAVATVGGARLLSMGVRPEQIKVITFGAPAVGNEAFCRRYEPVLDVSRVVISGDIITGILQKVKGGYRQFGREIRWKVKSTAAKSPHEMAEYLDLAVKNNYDRRERAEQAGMIAVPRQKEALRGMVYVAPLRNRLPEGLQGEFSYMRQAWRDECRQAFPGYVFGGETAKATLGEAAEAGCRWLAVPEVSTYKPREGKDCGYITLSLAVYDTRTGEPAHFAVYSTGTENMTPLEALIHDATEMRGDAAVWLERE